MSSVDIQIVNASNLEKIANFLNDSSYRETIEFSANFNTRLCCERRLRVPFLDPQTGVAQHNSQLFMDSRQRMPGFREGQLYTYPSSRWRKPRRQYLTRKMRPFANLVSSKRIEGGGLAGNSAASGYIDTTVHDFSGILSRNVSGTSGPGAAIVGLSGNAVGVGGGGSGNSSLPITGGGVIAASTSTSTSGNSLNSIGIIGNPNLSSSYIDDSHGSTTSGGGGNNNNNISGLLIDYDSKDGSQSNKDDIPKEWFFDDMDLNELDSFYEPKSPADDEYDYDPRYGNKKRKKRKPGRKPSMLHGPHQHHPHHTHHPVDGPPRKGRPPGGGRGRGRRKNTNTNATRSSILEPPPSPTSSIIEPPSFEMAAAAVEHANEDSTGSSDLRSYRKYLS